MELDDLDLDISNYDINDIMKLFKIDYNYDISTLKNIKKQILKVHPDKSKLNPKYFIFFKSAFDILVRIYKFRTNHQTFNTKEDEDISSDLSRYFEGKSTSDFNKEFNEIFENVYMKNESENNGYEAWLKSDNDFITKEKDAEKFREGTIQVYENKEIQPSNSSSIQFYDYENNNNFRSKNDIKNVYFNETIIPVNERHIMQEKQKFSSVQEYNTFRANELNRAYNVEKTTNHNEKFKELQDNDNRKSMNTAYNLMIQQQKYSDKYNNHVSKYLKLKNKI